MRARGVQGSRRLETWSLAYMWRLKLLNKKSESPGVLLMEEARTVAQPRGSPVQLHRRSPGPPDYFLEMEIVTDLPRPATNRFPPWPAGPVLSGSGYPQDLAAQSSPYHQHGGRRTCYGLPCETALSGCG